MKKIASLLFIFALSLVSGCRNTSDVGVHLTNSQRYTNAELKDAVEAVKSFFSQNYEDSTLYLIEYNDEHNEKVREDNWWKFRRSFEPKSLTDVLELSVSYYENREADNSNNLITETFYLVTLDNGKWEIGDHGRT